MNFRIPIYKTMKACHIEGKIKKSTMEVLNSVVVDIFKSLIKEAATFCEHSSSKSLRDDSIEAATRVVFPFTLTPYAIYEGRRAIR